MRAPILAAAALSLIPMTGCATYGDRYGFDRYDGYYERHYRAGRYDPRPLRRDDYIFRGSDGRYFCRRQDGTIGLVVGAGVGAVLGNILAPRGSGLLGTLIGGAAGGTLGYAIERQELNCH